MRSRCELLAALLICGIVLYGVPSGAQELTPAYDCATQGGINCRESIADNHGGAHGVLTSTLTVPDGTCIDPVIGRTVVFRELWHGSGGEIPFADLSMRVQSPTGTWGTITARPDLLPPLFGQSDDLFQAFSEPLTVFNAESASGMWTLEVTDHDNTDYGALDGWSLTFICGTVPEVSITASVPDAIEEPVAAGEFTISRSVVWDQAMTVNVWVTGSALHVIDYAALGMAPGDPLVVTIPANQSEVVVPIDPIADGHPEGAESVVLTLAEGLFYSIGGENDATVTIHDAQIQAAEIPAVNGFGFVLLTALLASAGVVALRLRQT
jgi:hypothetical protein